ncbi:MAG: response regulator [Anaerolineae bacterium]
MQEPRFAEEGSIGKRILIVDDEERLVYFLRVSLEKLGLGYQVVTAGCGEEALEALERFRFDLLITGFEIPEIDGLELIRRVRERSPGTLSILMTANGSPELEARAHLLQVYEYLAKPFSVDRLIERVQMALGDAVFPEEAMEGDQRTFEPPAEETSDFSRVRHPAFDPEGSGRREDVSPLGPAPRPEEFEVLGEEPQGLPSQDLGGEETSEGVEPELHEEVTPAILEEPEQTTLASASEGRELPLSEEVKEREQPVFETAETMPVAREKMISTLSPHRFEAIYNCLSDLRFEVGAQCVLLADILGELVAEVGMTTELDTATLISLLAGGYVTTFEMARQLGESRSFNLNFHEGERYDIYSSNVGDNFLLVILCDRQAGPSRVGMVWLYAKRAIEKLLGIMAQEEGIEAGEALGEEFGTSLRSELDNMFGEEPSDQPLSPEEEDLPLGFEEAKARGLVSDNIFPLSGDDSEEEKDAAGGEPKGF